MRRTARQATRVVTAALLGLSATKATAGDLPQPAWRMASVAGAASSPLAEPVTVRRAELDVPSTRQEAAAQSTFMAPPVSRLTGVAVSSADRVAVFANSAAGATVAVQEHDALGDMVVASIRPGLVVLVGADGAETTCRVGDACPGHPAAQGAAGTTAWQGAPTPAASADTPSATRYSGRRMLVASPGVAGTAAR